MTKRIKNHIVSVEEFMFEENDLTAKYDKLPITQLFMRFVWVVVWGGVYYVSSGL